MFTGAAAKVYMEEWVKDPSLLDIGDLPKALADPVKWKEHIVNVDVNELRHEIEGLEKTIKDAQARIIDVKGRLAEAEARKERLDKLRRDLVEGEPISKELLPTKDDLKREAKREARARIEFEQERFAQYGEKDGWNITSPNFNGTDVIVDANRIDLLTEETYEKLCELLSVPRPKGIGLQWVAVRGRRVTARYSKPLERPDLLSKNVLANAVESIKAYAEAWESGKVEPGYSSDTVIDFWQRQEALTPEEFKRSEDADKVRKMFQDRRESKQKDVERLKELQKYRPKDDSS